MSTCTYKVEAICDWEETEGMEVREWCEGQEVRKQDNERRRGSKFIHNKKNMTRNLLQGRQKEKEKWRRRMLSLRCGSEVSDICGEQCSQDRSIPNLSSQLLGTQPKISHDSRLTLNPSLYTELVLFNLVCLLLDNYVEDITWVLATDRVHFHVVPSVQCL